MGTRRKKKSGPLSSGINGKVAAAEPTITQNGALYQLQHRQPSLPPAGIPIFFLPPQMLSQRNAKQLSSERNHIGDAGTHQA
ncbi:MAG TPA: hypothetical protein VN904_03490 [Chthoniobacterales bacterium]|nr:hypothetical protein [Chthoniobacterales bacterium]